jgi:hypothetical protein
MSAVEVIIVMLMLIAPTQKEVTHAHVVLDTQETERRVQVRMLFKAL